MKIVVRLGCTLFHPDGSVWAKAGEVIDVGIDAADPAERIRVHDALATQRMKFEVAPMKIADRSDRSMEPTVTKTAQTSKTTRKKKGKK